MRKARREVAGRFCIYAIAGRTRRVRARGIGGEPVALISVGALSAIVGAVPRTPAPTRANLLRYDAVVASLARQLPALLPARFATMADAEELGFILRTRGASLRAALRVVRGRVQMTIRVLGSGDAPAMDVAAEPADQRRPSSGRAFLETRAAVFASARRVAGFDPVRAAVRRWIRQEAVERRGTVATVYHLIPRAAAPAYRRRAEAAAAAAQLPVVVSGPFPPYAFAAIGV